MHPDLLNNPLFLRYYHQWQRDPQSIVFVAIADFFLRYHLLDDALKVCREGLRHHPQCLSAKLLLARVHIARGNWEEAEEEVQTILANHPGHQQALILHQKIKESKIQEEKHEEKLPENWETITMAEIFQAQGHADKARKIFESILRRDPHNHEAEKRLIELSK
ncbi:MAG: hypothetical protein A3I05_08185 [Deltaproteobacteria bacterium RIFCSPLOWO2_02_FULL_44_10]|nr:MAG: hypothetical protein A3C46_05070 [Deltaproteobacteria bacterium RIFCSPHIGHO2_02_FULL_44_16]OGQ45937.1 MAG: hypothetical protein A3I05_08185 [Deltaproteobacteria bacterium RIFCSPLOWO2_02_FULL_44_10]